MITESATEEQTTPRARPSRRTDVFPLSPSVTQAASNRRCNDKPQSGPENCSDNAVEPHGAPNDSPISTRSVKQGRKQVVQTRIQPKRNSPPLSAPVSTPDHLASLDGNIPMTIICDPTHSDKARPKPSYRPMKSLRLADHAPRKMLLCQTLGRTSVVKPPRPPSRHSNLNSVDEKSLGTKPKATKRSRDAQPQRGPTSAESPPACSSPAFATQQAYFDATHPRQSNDNSARNLSRDDDAAAPNVADDDPDDLLPQNRETLPPPDSITLPPYTKPVPRRPQLKHKPPPDYSHLDAQLFFHPSLLPTAHPNVQPSHIQPSNIHPSEIPTLDPEPPVIILSPQRPPNRTLARALSDTAAANPPRRLKQPWRRAETIAHPGAAADAGRAQWQGRGQGQEKEKGKDKGEDGDVGPWSREAWDLFGWCPEGKRGVLEWGYGETGGGGGVEV